MFINLEYFFNLLYRLITGRAWWSWLVAIDAWWRWLALVVTPLALAGIIYLTYLIVILRKKEATDFNLARLAAMEKPKTNPRWQKIEAALATDDPNAWRLAIIEADNILSEVVQEMNYPGETLGEQLKSVEPSDFLTLNDAWEAHKIRNRIVHESQLTLTRREVEETLRRYRRVFEEFDYL